jgi:hypothetical protein
MHHMIQRLHVQHTGRPQSTMLIEQREYFSGSLRIPGAAVFVAAEDNVVVAAAKRHLGRRIRRGESQVSNAASYCFGFGLLKAMSPILC